MSEEVRIKNTGLRGVTVADSAVSFIDGEKGILIYRGYRVEDLAERSNFLETVYLLLFGALPNEEQLARFSDRLRARRALPPFVLESMQRYPKTAQPMDVLQATVPLLAMADTNPRAEDRDSVVERAVGLIAQLPCVVAAWHRIRSGQEVIAPDDTLGHAENFLWMLHGVKPEAQMAGDLDVCLVLHADHTFNASTFAAREVVSTRASIYAGVTAALGALSGGLHGGANTRVMEMLLQLAEEKNIKAWVENRIDQGKVIMGMGHAVYKTGDPRAAYLRKMGRRLDESTGSNWAALASEIEQAALARFKAEGKTTIQVNVDFCSAPVYYMMGIPIDLMTTIFAISRVAGWCAHVIEEKFADAQGKPALYRPEAQYVGEYCGLMGCSYTPMEGRSN
ncbi:MAG: citrate/2-methylcitrate synthase [bacterium]|nr:citrate/2-methylcitrate synthase [bacterium]